MNPYQRAALKAHSEDTILHYQNCPNCNSNGFYHDYEIVDQLNFNGSTKKIKLMIGEKKISLVPKPGITEVRWVEKEFQVIQLNATSEDWWHKCNDGHIVSSKIFHDLS